VAIFGSTAFVLATACSTTGVSPDYGDNSCHAFVIGKSDRRIASSDGIYPQGRVMYNDTANNLINTGLILSVSGDSAYVDFDKPMGVDANGPIAAMVPVSMLSGQPDNHCVGYICNNSPVITVDSNGIPHTGTVQEVFNNGLATAIYDQPRDQWGNKMWTDPATSMSLQNVAPPVFSGGDLIKVTSINGVYDPNQNKTKFVHPGDLISLAADLFDTGYNPQNAYADNFSWKASDGKPACNGYDQTDCLLTTNFSANDYGVSYYTPYANWQKITITVNDSVDSIADNGNPDVITLYNVDYTPGAQPALFVITDPSMYTYGTMNYDYALAGQGRWVYIDGYRYFAPTTYVVEDEIEWVPYRHGYWNYVDGDGFTWVSYDPWGWVTDHYGEWRYHGVYGWIWSPFDDFHYERATATFYYDGDYCGWSPYHSNYARGYVHGYNEGFRDGYEEGFLASQNHFGHDDYHPGLSLIHNHDFHPDNNGYNMNTVIINKTIVQNNVTIINNNSTVTSVINNSSHNSNYGVHPYAKTPEDAKAIVEKNTGKGVVSAKIDNVGGKGNIKTMIPDKTHEPAVYKTVAAAPVLAKPDPIGSVRKATPTGAVAVKPTSNGKGIVPPPHTVDSSGKPAGDLPAHTKTPAAANPSAPTAPAKPTVPPPVHTAPPKLPPVDPKKQPPAKPPVTPVTPVTPVKPVTPVTPVKPVTPVTPVKPVTPVTPVKPVIPPAKPPAPPVKPPAPPVKKPTPPVKKPAAEGQNADE
jgi:hypothetical protein